MIAACLALSYSSSESPSQSDGWPFVTVCVTLCL
jgi:hypothetical protein